MKLLYIIIGLQNEGISNALIERLNYLSEKTDFELHILAEGTNSIEMIQKLNDKIHLHNIEIRDLLDKDRLPFFGYFSLKSEILTKYKFFLKTIDPNIITSFNLESHLKEIIPLVKSKALKVIELHGSLLGGENAREYKKYIKPKKRFQLLSFFRIPDFKLHNLYDYATVLTKEDLQDRNYLNTPTLQIYNPVVKNEIVSDFRERDNIILAVGRLSSHKNYSDLILAISKIEAHLNTWQVHIYGTGPERNFLESCINELELQDRIFLKGNAYDMTEVYNNAKILVSTSLTEGFGRTLTEAFSFKIPVISYNCKCGPKEIIREDINGFLVDFNVDDLASKILLLTAQEELLQNLSDNTADSLNKFDFENIMRQWVQFYKSIGN